MERCLFFLIIGLFGALSCSTVAADDVLPRTPPAFRGQIGLRAAGSKPDFPQPVKAPKGAPNILLVLLDDVGFAAPSTFGGAIATPTLDALARDGLRYNQFHTTALCSPTRAALITGRNHHSVHTGVIMEAGTGYPGYDTLMQKDTATIAEVLKQNGWNTAWFGKNHNVPDWQSSQAGPFDLWPTGLGFETFYGFIGGDTHQWRPAVIEGTRPIEPYLGKPDYHFDDDIADQAIRYIRTQKAVAPDRPFFVYYAPGATHAPHHPRPEFAAKYRGKFDQGWDKLREEVLARQKKLGVVPNDAKLTPRPEGIAAWDSLPDEQRRLYARMMELYAGYLEQTDHNVGRVVDAIRATGQLDNTLIVYIAGDNGASAEGSPHGLLNEMTFFNGIPEDLQQLLGRIDELGTWTTFNHYPVGWAHAMDTPFQWTKQIASHYGGTRNGMVISWPAKIRARGEVRSQWHHVIDIVPTLLDAVGLSMPNSVNGVAQKPVEGISMAYSFDDAKASSAHVTQYFEMMGNRAVYNDGWVAATTPITAPWDPAGSTVDVIGGYRWELYNVAKDFSEADNLAEQNPDKLKELQLLFYAEAARYNVLPLDNSKTERLDPAIRPSLTRGRDTFTFFEGMTRIPEGAAPDIKNKSFAVRAELDIPEAGASGMIVTQGGLFSGWALYLDHGRPVFHYNTADVFRSEVAASEPLRPGRQLVRLDFEYDGGGIGKGGKATIRVNGKVWAEGRIERTIPIRVTLDEGFDVGEDTGTPVNRSYDVPFRFPGHIEQVIVDLKPAVVPEPARKVAK
jgi:arylsulfatase